MQKLSLFQTLILCFALTCISTMVKSANSQSKEALALDPKAEPFTSDKTHQQLVQECMLEGMNIDEYLVDPQVPGYAKMRMKQMAACLASTIEVLRLNEQSEKTETIPCGNRCSVLVFGLKEQFAYGPIDQEWADRNQVMQILHIVGIDPVPPVTCFRIGTTMPRPLKIELPTERYANRLIRAQSLIRKQILGVSSIRRYMSPVELNAYRNTVKELRRRMALGEDVVIYAEKVMTRDELNGRKQHD